MAHDGRRRRRVEQHDDHVRPQTSAVEAKAKANERRGVDGWYGVLAMDDWMYTYNSDSEDFTSEVVQRGGAERI